MEMGFKKDKLIVSIHLFVIHKDYEKTELR